MKILQSKQTTIGAILAVLGLGWGLLQGLLSGEPVDPEAANNLWTSLQELLTILGVGVMGTAAADQKTLDTAVAEATAKASASASEKAAEKISKTS